jgi:prophage regulatory protein
MHKLPEIGYLRLPQILGNPKKNLPALIPISKSSWWAGIKAGKYPAGVKLGPRTTAWTVESIHTLIASTKIGAS